MRTVVMLFTRDLRVRDNPALSLACTTADRVVPLFVRDPALSVPPNRERFLLESLADLRESLRGKGGDLVIRHGDPVAETVKMARQVDATGVAMMADVSAYARARQRGLESERLMVKALPGVTVVPAGEIKPTTGGDQYKVFTPYFRAWQSHRWRSIAPTPKRIAVPEGLSAGQIEALPSVPEWTGGETAALKRLKKWRPLSDGYAEHHDDLAGDRTSRLSPYLHFGCLSPLELATAGLHDAFVRQLCWRDFYHQLLATFPAMARKAYRAGAVEQWHDDEEALQAWQTGHTGVDIVDAGMRQLLAQGWMHNRARLITASYLTKSMGLDWRAGADWFMRHLVDADVANNYGNWQWVAGTGTDTKPYRKFSPARQAQRFDAEGQYVKRWLGFDPPIRGKG
ncbi:deoxyribodipyrimidine photo-lyase [Rhizocola hellebori]|uniref:Deoxyribodipyrimidine photo-lyase n=1 Tax=Rhizocola hellebori TaxID=1392758 RepID=A0A8J3QKJ1_9ACTN|nr:deoxyribodipyrimidine photo-lyase [Rhizocola hellebori]GIH11093.1 deoxyribodipyrimidine photo-lyase [Rhizocola hellebori]